MKARAAGFFTLPRVKTAMSYGNHPSRDQEMAFGRPPSFPALADMPGMDEYPPSCHAVLLAVVTNGPLTIGEVRACTGLSTRTVRYAVRRLKAGGEDNPEYGHIETEPSLHDARTKRVSLGADIEVPTQFKDGSL